MERILAILDQEGDYGERLCEYLNRRKCLPCTAATFSSLESYLAFAENHRVQILLAQPELLTGVYDLHADQVLQLWDAGQDRGALLEKRDAVYKYQSGEEILRAVMVAAGEAGLGFGAGHTGGEKRLISVFSPVGRCYKTSFALLFSALRARRERVLYLNLEKFSGLSRLLGESYERGLGDAFYHLRRDSLDGARIGTLLHSFYGVDYIPPFLSPEDQEALEPGDHTALVERIMEETEHTLMVADLGGFSAAALAMMELSDVVYMPVLEDFISEGKCGEFLDYLKEMGKSRILERIQKLRLPQPGTIRSRDSYLDSLLLSPLGDYAREVAGC